MLSQFTNHLQARFSFLENKKLLLAVSGGLDSMVLLHLFQQLPYEIAVAHCNFQLRGTESFGDQAFVKEYCDLADIPIHITQFDTVAYANDFKKSTQIAARELRYSWFYELAEEGRYDYILTAHHADDNLETFIINLSRGTGLEGLIGIPEHNDKIIRPLLPFSRQQIRNYCQAQDLIWREDSSNATTKYVRNKIRHDLIPILKEINPDFLGAFEKTQAFLNESHEMVEDATIMIYQQVAREVGDEIHFDLNQLLKLPNYHSYLYQWLKEFGFQAWTDIYNLVKAQSGKQVVSANYRLVKNRNTLLLCPKIDEESTLNTLIYPDDEEVLQPIRLKFQNVNQKVVSSKNEIIVDKDLLKYPLELRKWKDGDCFKPFGMKGQSKKVSKLLKDEKLSIIEKEVVYVLTSEEQIIWVVGIRESYDFQITDKTKNILKIALQ